MPEPLTWDFLESLQWLPLAKAEALVRQRGYIPVAIPETVEITVTAHQRPGVVLLSHEENEARTVRCAHAGAVHEVR